jgi:hypothetical protein
MNGDLRRKFPDCPQHEGRGFLRHAVAGAFEGEGTGVWDERHGA